MGLPPPLPSGGGRLHNGEGDCPLKWLLVWGSERAIGTDEWRETAQRYTYIRFPGLWVF